MQKDGFSRSGASLPAGVAGIFSNPTFICLTLAAVTIALYWPATGFDFVNWDDPAFVLQNPRVLEGFSWANVCWAFTNLTSSGYWQPVIWLSYMLDATLFGPGAAGFHFTNILLHAVNAVLVFLLFRRMTGAYWRSALVAALFALHPLRVESVAWVAERKDVLSTFLALLTLWFYARYIEREKARGTGAKGPLPGFLADRDYQLTLLFYVLALMSKTMVVTLPILMLLLDFWPFRRLTNGNARSAIVPLFLEKLPMFVGGAICGYLTLVGEKQVGAMTVATFLPAKLRLANVFPTYVMYLWQTIWPTKLAFHYQYPRVLLIQWVVAAAVLLAAITVLVLWQLRQRPYLFVGWFWYVVMILPVSGIVTIGTHARADRYTYGSLLGIFLIVSWVAAELAGRLRLPRGVMAVTAGLVLATCTVLTRDQIGTWRNDGTLFAHAVTVDPNNFVARYNLACYLDGQGRIEEAATHYREAARILPHNRNSHLNLATALERLRRTGEAEAEYREALRIDPKSFEAHYNYGCLLLDLGRREEAIEHFKESLRLNPDQLPAKVQLQRLEINPAP